MSNREHAVVIGGSMAGMLAGRILSDHYRRVTVVDRDILPAEGVNRRGVPQGRHTHGLLASGGAVLEQLFPGITRELQDAGAVTTDAVRDGRWFHQGACLRRPASGMNGMLASRPMLEGAVRRRFFELPNVAVRSSRVVESLVPNADRSAVTGVRLEHEILDADLVVDASGRGSHAAQWLEGIGYAPPREDRVEVGVGYTTRLFRRTPEHLNGDTIVVIPQTPEGKRAGVMLAQEGGRWTVTLISYFGHYAPSDLKAFIEYARTLPAPDIWETIRHADPLGEAAEARFPASLRRRYEQMERFPEGFLTFGDAICSFNPIYGQGMSVAALEAVQLDRALSEGAAGLAPRFFARAAKVVEIPWSIAVGNDLRIPETVGPRTLATRSINWYVGKVHRAAHHDDAVSLAFHRVGNLLAQPESLMQPWMAGRVLWRNLAQMFGGRQRSTPNTTPATVRASASVAVASPRD